MRCYRNRARLEVLNVDSSPHLTIAEFARVVTKLSTSEEKEIPTPTPTNGSAELGEAISKREISKPAAEKALEQADLLEVPKDWGNLWKGMPTFNQANLMPWQTIKIHFRNAEDRRTFSELIGHRVYDGTQSLWFPKAEIGEVIEQRLRTEKLPKIEKSIEQQAETQKELESIDNTNALAERLKKLWERYSGAVIRPETIAALLDEFDAIAALATISTIKEVWGDFCKELLLAGDVAGDVAGDEDPAVYPF
jgi:hypothetical protein